MGRDPFDDGRAPVLDEAQRAYVEGWLRASGDLLGLRDWRIEASCYVSQKSSDASSFIRDNTDEIVVSVGPDFVGSDADEQRATLAHELLHAHFYRVTRMAERLFANELGQRTEAVIETAVEIVEEQTIDRLAHAIAGWLPKFALPKAA